MYYIIIGIFIPILLIGQKNLGLFAKSVVAIYIILAFVIGGLWL